MKVASEGGPPAAAVSSTLIWITVVEGSAIKIDEKMDWEVTVDMAVGERRAVSSSRRRNRFSKQLPVTHPWLRLLLARHSTWGHHHLESPVRHRVPRRGRSAGGGFSSGQSPISELIALTASNNAVTNPAIPVQVKYQRVFMLLPLVPVRAVNVPAALSSGAERVPPSKPPPLVLVGPVRAERGVAATKSESWIPGGCCEGKDPA